MYLGGLVDNLLDGISLIYVGIVFGQSLFYSHSIGCHDHMGNPIILAIFKKDFIRFPFIIDPLITLPLLIGCIGSTWKRSYKPALVGVCFITFYLIFSITAHSFMMSKFKNAFETQQIKIDSQMVRPTPFNTLFWAVSATTDSEELIFGYARLWDSPNTIEFSKPVNQNLEQLTPIAQRYDLNQLLAITRGFYIVESSENIIVIKDARFGKFGGWTDTDNDSFIFQYRFDVKTKKWTQYRPPLNDKGQLFRSLIQAIIN